VVNLLKKYIESVRVLELDHMMMVVLEFVESIVVVVDGDDVFVDSE
jgi:hypothetical protein